MTLFVVIEREENICPSCGAVIRPKAVFCHRCGKTLVDGGTVRETQNLSATALEVEPSEDKVENSETVSAVPPPIAVSEPETVSETTPVEPENKIETENTVEVVEQPSDKVETAPQPVKTRTKQRYVKQTEYVWEDANAPTWRLLLLAVVAFGVVASLLWIGNFWK